MFLQYTNSICVILHVKKRVISIVSAVEAIGGSMNHGAFLLNGCVMDQKIALTAPMKLDAFAARMNISAANAVMGEVAKLARH